MTESLDHELYWQALRFENECLKRRGSDFQALFEAVMNKVDPSFQTVKPWGREGDRKCDGFSPATETLFQVYAPEEMTDAAAIAKIEEDFSGGKEHWGKFKRWVFVWSAVDPGLSPGVTEKLKLLREDEGNAEIAIEDWGQDNLWDLVKKLTLQQRAELLGSVPVPTQTTAAEIQTVVNWLTESGPAPVDPAEGFEHTAIGDKIELNDLSEHVAEMIARALPVAAAVGQYVSNSYDADFSSKVAAILIARYQRLETLRDDPDKIFVALVDGVASGPDPTQAEWWGAVGVVSYYFELCDIFKKQ